MGFVATEVSRHECSTLILIVYNFHCLPLLKPAISIGNVGQLAVDLLVSSTKAERIGYLDDDCVLPCVGNDAYSSSSPGTLTLPLEVYDAPSFETTILVQRSPVVRGMMLEFARNLADVAISCGKKHVIVLSSLDFGRWRNIETSSGLSIYYISSINPDGSNEQCEHLGWKRLPEYNPSQATWQRLIGLSEGNNVSDEYELEQVDDFSSLPFAALFGCLKAKGLKVTCVLCYCSEGDNREDALALAKAALKLRGHDDVEWIVPNSWRTVYGPPPDMMIF